MAAILGDHAVDYPRDGDVHRGVAHRASRLLGAIVTQRPTAHNGSWAVSALPPAFPSHGARRSAVARASCPCFTAKMAVLRTTLQSACPRHFRDTTCCPQRVK